ncbi:ABC transporter permease subunit [Clostridium swellfunianum]|uniref:ABC transporter permease n=1 Tax=Clostridium swellfunianum TaxID=1367462 RepID=UPI00202E184A|nr:ABC transporter permease subunit [Clostridium swellfunianum]MCM0649352.1 ABC transporter permease subunit [Clostridium swellfunianum]
MNTEVMQTSKTNTKRSFKKQWKNILNYKYLYIMLIPVLVWYLIFCYVPMYGIIMAFQDFTMSKGFFNSPFVGLKHFVELFSDADFWRAFWNTVIIAIYRLLTQFPIPIVIALLLNEVRHSKFRKSVQTVIYLPHFISWVIVASIFVTFFSPESGILAALFAGHASDLMTKPEIFRPILILTDLWKEAGFSTVIYVAAMASISTEHYEAAVMDGAGRWSLLWNVTLPGIRSVILIMFILTIGRVLTWGFDQVYNFYNPMVYSTGDILDTYIFRTALGDGKFSYAAAAGLLKSVICTFLLVTSNRVVKAFGEESVY